MAGAISARGTRSGGASGHRRPALALALSGAAHLALILWLGSATLRHEAPLEAGDQGSLAVVLAEAPARLAGSSVPSGNPTPSPGGEAAPALTVEAPTPAPASRPAGELREADQHERLATSRAASPRSANVAAPALNPAQALAQVRHRLAEHFRYPPLARRKGWQGTVVLAFRLEWDGRIGEPRVRASSGYGLLDRAALEALRKVERVEAGSLGLQRRSTELELPVIYRLQQG